MKKNIIFLGADHAGFALKESLEPYLTRLGFSVMDETPLFAAGDDYPPIAKRVARQVAKGKGLGLLICGSGYGMDIAANRVKGVRASVCHSPEHAKHARKDDHSNVLVLGERATGLAQAKKIVSAWIHTKPSLAARHLRRIKMLDV